MYVIAHNLVAMNTNRQLNKVTSSSRKTTEKLSSGYRINRSADDAAGLSISEKMRAQIRGLNRGAANLQDGINYVQVADGALNEIHSMLHRMKELAVQSANGTNTDMDRVAINTEVEQLKEEMDHIFNSTEFNTIKIWPQESISNAPFVSGTTEVQALKITTPSMQTLKLTNDSYDKIALGSYKILADQQGVSLTWTDYAGRTHTTSQASWDDLKNNNYSFQIADFFDPADTVLFDANNNPLFDFKVSFSVAKKATVDHMIAALNNTTMSSSPYGRSSIRFENSANEAVSTPGVSAGMSINYSALYASRANADSSQGEVGFDFNQVTDAFIEAKPVNANGGNIVSGPNITDVAIANSSADNWTFKFYMEGIGDITATSNAVSYNSSEKSDSTENLWWYYTTDSKGRKTKLSRSITSDEEGNGTLGAVMDCLTGDRNSSTPGLLASEGLSTVGGTISLKFDLKSDTDYSYGNNKTSNSIGTITLSINVTNTDTEQTVLDKINNALNDSTILDMNSYSSSGSIGYCYVHSSSAHKSMAPEDVYSNSFTYGDVNLTIHNGPNKNDTIPITYDCLRVDAIGLTDTNLLTSQSSNNALVDIENALTKVSEQRSLFGAYQNRMEYSLTVNQNISENTSAAESRIRDLDMADAMVEHSKEAILIQAGQSLLAQANKNPQGVLTLLNQ